MSKWGEKYQKLEGFIEYILEKKKGWKGIEKWEIVTKVVKRDV